MMATTYTPRVYVGTYGKYNAGSIKGAWLDLEDYTDSESFYEACKQLHQDEHDPEFMFQDHEDIPDGLIGESHLDDAVWDWIQLDDDDRELLAVYQEHVNQDGDIDDARDAFMGTYDSEEEWAEEYISSRGLLDQVPERLQFYFDFKAYARDAGYDGVTFVRHGGSVWVFA